MLYVQLDDSTVLKEKVAHCHLKRLGLSGGSTLLIPVLSGVRNNSSITELDVESKPMPATTVNQAWHPFLEYVLMECQEG